MSNGRARRTAVHIKHISKMFAALSHYLTVLWKFSFCPPGLRESLPRVKHSKC